MDKIYKGNLQSINCGKDDQFKYNEDKSFIKCISCGQEYPGGYKELFDLNFDNINKLKKTIAEDLKNIIIERLNVSSLGLGTTKTNENGD